MVQVGQVFEATQVALDFFLGPLKLLIADRGEITTSVVLSVEKIS
jgi:hypothetical protein